MSDNPNKDKYIGYIETHSSIDLPSFKCLAIASRLCLGGDYANGYSIDDIITSYHQINQNCYPENCFIKMMNMFINEKMYHEAFKLIELAKTIVQDPNRVCRYKCIAPEHIPRWEKKISTFVH